MYFTSPVGEKSAIATDHAIGLLPAALVFGPLYVTFVQATSFDASAESFHSLLDMMILL